LECANGDASAALGGCAPCPSPPHRKREQCSIIALVAIQILDGVGAGIFGGVSVLVIADLTQGSGRFNFTLGAISTAVGIGASLSQVIAGSIVHHSGFNAGFLFLAAVAAVALCILYFFMPETRDKQFPNPTQGAATP
jgi:MFS family permease